MNTKLNEIINIIEQIKKPKKVIAVTGSVAAGKTTFSHLLKEALCQENLTVEIISTDNFIKSNKQLIEEDIFDQKGFPNSYNLLALENVILEWQQGLKQIIPCYDQSIADISKDKEIVVENTDVLIVEGVTAFRVSKKLIDLSIFLEAHLTSIKDWYLNRTLQFIDKANEDNWYFSYKKMSTSDKIKKIMSVWDEVNYFNYLKYIEPLKEDVDLVVLKDQNHQIIEIQENKKGKTSLSKR